MVQQSKPRVIVMTGGTSGFGACTLQYFAKMPDTRVITGARGTGRAVPSGVEVLPLELSSLASVREFAAAVTRQLDGVPIDILVLNAGIRGSKAEERSTEGFGRTFATNHLSHYLLARLLLPNVADHGRIVITSSNMHNPPIKAIGPKSLDIEGWAHPTKGGSGDGVRSYCASKLCNLMTALSFDRLDEVKARDISVIAFNPGLTGGVAATGASVISRILVGVMQLTVFPLLRLFNPVFTPNTPEHSGRMLADVALGKIDPPPGQVYVSLVKGEPTFETPSDLARSQPDQDRLWRESAGMVGLA